MINLRRFYHISCVNYSMKKQGIKLSKMVNPSNKRQWYPTQSLEGNAMPSLKSLTKVKHEPGKRGLRRTAMLNKMFMKQITDIMSTGTVSLDIIGRGIEISKVNVAKDFKTVSVFWVCKGDVSDEETESVLNKTAGTLRHELSTLRVMGEIPFVVFVKDKQEAQIVELDRRLASADYGEEYTPTELGHLLKSEFVLNTKLSPEVKAKIQQLEDRIPIVNEPIPVMSHNIYGLDHAKIMNRLLGARKKTKEAWDNLAVDPNVISYRAADNEAVETTTCNQRKELADFLLKRQILQKKLEKEARESRKDWQLEMSSADAGLGDDDDADDEFYADDDDDVNDDDLYHVEYDKQPIKNTSTTKV